MTTARFWENGSRYEISITGHAGYNTNGPDIACASCSALAYTLLNEILTVDAEGGVHGVSTEINDADGVFKLSFYTNPSARDRVHNSVNLILSGFCLLANRYPDFVIVACA